MLNRFIGWIQSRKILISSFVIAIMFPGSRSVHESTSWRVHVYFPHLNFNNHGDQLLNTPFDKGLTFLIVWLVLWILLHLAQGLFRAMERR